MTPMMTPQDNQSQDKSQDTNEQEAPQEGGSPLDDLIAKIESYIKDPRLVTPETLTDVKSELMDLKSYMDGGETADEPTQQDGPPDEGNGLHIVIGKMRGGK